MTEKEKNHITVDVNEKITFEVKVEGMDEVKDVPIEHEHEDVNPEDFNFDYVPKYMDIDNTEFDINECLPYLRVQIDNIPEQRIDNFFRYCLHKPITIAIVAASGEGKTSLLYKMFDEYKGPKPMVMFKHPNPNEIENITTKNGKFVFPISNFSQIVNGNNFIVAIDEPQILFPGRKGFDDLLKFLSIARHKDITVIFLSNESRWFQARIEAHIQCWFIKDQDPYLIKRMSVVNKIIKKVFPYSNDEYKLNVDEFIFYSRKYDYFNSGEGEVYRFKMASWFNENLSKSYRKTALPQTPPKEPLCVVVQN